MGNIGSLEKKIKERQSLRVENFVQDLLVIIKNKITRLWVRWNLYPLGQISEEWR
jgi:hypothetical protein